MQRGEGLLEVVVDVVEEAQQKLDIGRCGLQFGGAEEGGAGFVETVQRHGELGLEGEGGDEVGVFGEGDGEFGFGFREALLLEERIRAVVVRRRQGEQ